MQHIIVSQLMKHLELNNYIVSCNLYWMIDHAIQFFTINDQKIQLEEIVVHIYDHIIYVSDFE